MRPPDHGQCMGLQLTDQEPYAATTRGSNEPVITSPALHDSDQRVPPTADSASYDTDMDIQPPLIGTGKHWHSAVSLVKASSRCHGLFNTKALCAPLRGPTGESGSPPPPPLPSCGDLFRHLAARTQQSLRNLRVFLFSPPNNNPATATTSGFRGLISRHIPVRLEAWEAYREEVLERQARGVGVTPRRSLVGLPLLHPSCGAALGWAAAMLLFDLVFTAFWVPINVAFCLDQYGDLGAPCTRTDLAGGVIYLVNVLFSFNIGVSLTCGYRLRVVTDGRDAARMYCSTFGFWLDVAAVVPFVYLIVVLIMGDDITRHQTVSVISLMRLVRLGRVASIIKQLYVSSTGGEFRSSWLADHFSVTPLYMMLLSYLTAVLVNLYACVLLLVAYYAQRDGNVSWMNSIKWQDVEALDGAQQWWNAVYFSITVMTTTGFADFLPKNPAEQVVCICMMCNGVFIFGALIALIGSALRRSQAHAQSLHDARHKLGQIRKWLQEGGVPVGLQRDVITFFAELGAKRDEGRTEGDIVFELPAHLRQKVTRYLLLDLLPLCPPLRDLASEVRELVASHCVPLELPTGQELFRLGEEADGASGGLWLVEEGVVCAYRHQERIEAPVSPGGRGLPCLLGEGAVLADIIPACSTRMWTLRTERPCRVWQLRAPALRAVLQIYPNLAAHMMVFVRDRIMGWLDGKEEGEDEGWCELVQLLKRSFIMGPLRDRIQDCYLALQLANITDGTLAQLLAAWLAMSAPREMTLRDEGFDENDPLAMTRRTVSRHTPGANPRTPLITPAATPEAPGSPVGGPSGPAPPPSPPSAVATAAAASLQGAFSDSLRHMGSPAPPAPPPPPAAAAVPPAPGSWAPAGGPLGRARSLGRGAGGASSGGGGSGIVLQGSDSAPSPLMAPTPGPSQEVGGAEVTGALPPAVEQAIQLMSSRSSRHLRASRGLIGDTSARQGTSPQLSYSGGTATAAALGHTSATFFAAAAGAAGAFTSRSTLPSPEGSISGGADPRDRFSSPAGRGMTAALVATSAPLDDDPSPFATSTRSPFAMAARAPFATVGTDPDSLGEEAGDRSKSRSKSFINHILLEELGDSEDGTAGTAATLAAPQSASGATSPSKRVTSCQTLPPAADVTLAAATSSLAVAHSDCGVLPHGNGALRRRHDGAAHHIVSANFVGAAGSRTNPGEAAVLPYSRTAAHVPRPGAAPWPPHGPTAQGSWLVGRAGTAGSAGSGAGSGSVVRCRTVPGNYDAGPGAATSELLGSGSARFVAQTGAGVGIPQTSLPGADSSGAAGMPAAAAPQLPINSSAAAKLTRQVSGGHTTFIHKIFLAAGVDLQSRQPARNQTSIAGGAVGTVGTAHGSIAGVVGGSTIPGGGGGEGGAAGGAETTVPHISAPPCTMCGCATCAYCARPIVPQGALAAMRAVQRTASGRTLTVGGDADGGLRKAHSGTATASAANNAAVEPADASAGLAVAAGPAMQEGRPSGRQRSQTRSSSRSNLLNQHKQSRSRMSSMVPTVGGLGGQWSGDPGRMGSQGLSSGLGGHGSGGTGNLTPGVALALAAARVSEAPEEREWGADPSGMQEVTAPTMSGTMGLI